MIKRFTIAMLLLCPLISMAQLKKNTPLPIINMTKTVNFGHKEASNRTIDIIVVHSTYSTKLDSFNINNVLNQFKQYDVSSHYIIGRKGEVYLTVNESNIAYHAGISTLPGTNRTNLNTNSIGIELINTPKTKPTDAQYESLLLLIKDIKIRYPIKYIVRHSDIAPGRKTDPWLFEWDEFKTTMLGE